MLNPSIQVLALPFKKGTKRADKANAVELYVSLTEGDELDEVDAIEKEAFDKLMDGAYFIYALSLIPSLSLCLHQLRYLSQLSHHLHPPVPTKRLKRLHQYRQSIPSRQ